MPAAVRSLLFDPSKSLMRLSVIRPRGKWMLNQCMTIHLHRGLWGLQTVVEEKVKHYSLLQLNVIRGIFRTREFLSGKSHLFC